MAKRNRVSEIKADNLPVASSSNTPLRAPKRKSVLATLDGRSSDDDGDRTRHKGPLLGKDCVDPKATKDEEEPQLVPRKPPWLTEPTYVLYMEQKKKEALEDLRFEAERKEREHQSRLLNARIKDALKTAAIAARFDARKSRIVRRLVATTGIDRFPDSEWRSVEKGLEDLGIDIYEDDEPDSAGCEVVQAKAEVEENELEEDDFELTTATFTSLLRLLKSGLQELCEARSIQVVSSWTKPQLANALLQWRDERGAISASEGADAAPRLESVDMGLNTSPPASMPTNKNHLAEHLSPRVERKEAQCSSVSAASAAAITHTHTPTPTAPKPSLTSVTTGTISPETEEKIAEVSIALRSALAEMRSERSAEKARANRRFSEFASEFETRMEERIRQLDNRHRAQRAQDREREVSRWALRQEADLVLQKARDETRDKVTSDVHSALTILAERLGNVTRDVGVLFSATGVSPAGAAVVQDAGEEGTSFAAMGRKRRRIAATAAAEEKRRRAANIVGNNILERLEGIEMNILECLEKTKDPEAGLANPPQTPPQGRGNDIATNTSGPGLRWPWVGGKWLGGT